MAQPTPARAQLGWIQTLAGAGMLPGLLWRRRRRGAKARQRWPGKIKNRWHKQQQHRLCPALSAQPVPTSTATLQRARCQPQRQQPLSLFGCSKQVADSAVSCGQGVPSWHTPPLEESWAWHSSRVRWHQTSPCPAGVCHPASCHPTPLGFACLPPLPVAWHWLRWDTGKRRFSAPLRVSRQKDSRQGLLGKPSALCLGWQQNPSSVEAGGEPRSGTPP